MPYMIVARRVEKRRSSAQSRTREAEAAKALESVITCPACGATALEVMPTDACLFFYQCKQCRKLLRPNRGDCCVFCSFGIPAVAYCQGTPWRSEIEARDASRLAEATDESYP